MTEAIDEDQNDYLKTSENSQKVLFFLKKLFPELADIKINFLGPTWRPVKNELGLPAFTATLVWFATAFHEIGHYKKGHIQDNKKLESLYTEVEKLSPREIIDVATRSASPLFEEMIQLIQAHELEAWEEGLRLLTKHKEEVFQFLNQVQTKDLSEELLYYIDGHYSAYAAKFVRMIEDKFSPSEYTAIQQFIIDHYFSSVSLYDLWEIFSRETESKYIK